MLLYYSAITLLGDHRRPKYPNKVGGLKLYHFSVQWGVKISNTLSPSDQWKKTLCKGKPAHAHIHI